MPDAILDEATSSQTVRTPYEAIPRALAQDLTISMAARGLLVHLLSLPPGWTLNVRTLSESTKEGRESLENAYRELREAGYLRAVKLRGQDGRISTRTQWRDDLRQPWPEQSAAPATPPGPGLPDSGEPADRDRVSRDPVEPVSQRLQTERTNTLTGVGGTRQDQPTVNQRAQALAKAYYEREPMCRFPSIMNAAKTAIRTGNYSDDEIREALLRLAAEGRSVTIETLRIEMNGTALSSGRGRTRRGELDAGVGLVDGYVIGRRAITP